MAYSLFTRKKEDPYAANMTSAKTGQAVYGGGAYQSTTPNLLKSVTNTIASSAFPSQAYKQSSQGYFTQAPKTPQMSVAPKTTTPTVNTSQMSGYGSQYGGNEFNQPLPTPPAPKPQVNPMDAQTKAINDWLKSMGEQTQQRVQETQNATNQLKDTLGQRYDLMGEAIRGQIPVLTDTFNRFKSNTNADIADVVAQGELQKDQAKDYYGEANRTAAQARQETGQQATRKFAGQGAIDSAGAGSYQEANANIDSEFNRVVAQNAKALAGKQTEIDMAIGQYQRQAKSLIQQEEANLMENIRNIEIQFKDNELGKQQAITELVTQAQERVYAIQDKMSEIEQQALQQKQNIALELQKLDTTKLSPEFMATGKPTNQAEYDYLVQNADKFKTLGIIGDEQSGGNQNKALTMVNRLLGADTKGITGAMRTGNIPVLSTWSGTAPVQADYDGLKSLLALAERGQLKGSGAVSDFEARVLEKAAMAGLNQNLPDEEFRRRLQVLQQDLMSGGAVANGNDNMSMASGGKVRVISPDGTAGEIDASELQEALANGWRQA